MSNNQDIFGTEPGQGNSGGGAGGTVTLMGDATGTSNANTVVAVQHIPYSTTLPTVGQSPVFDGTEYTPGSPSAAPPVKLIDMGFTIDPGVFVGQILYQSSLSTLDTASGNSIDKALAYGVYAGTPGTVTTWGAETIFVEAGLTLHVNDILYLSLTPGQATNIPPTIPSNCITVVGVLKGIAGYNPMIGSALPALFRPELPIEIF